MKVSNLATEVTKDFSEEVMLEMRLRYDFLFGDREWVLLYSPGQPWLVILLPHFPQCRGYRCVSPCPTELRFKKGSYKWQRKGKVFMSEDIACSKVL
jgi:hypothetical protein